MEGTPQDTLGVFFLEKEKVDYDCESHPGCQEPKIR